MDRASVLERHLAAENEHDIDGILATFAPDGVVVLSGRVIEGREQVRGFHERLGFGGQGVFADIRVVERCRHPSADAIVVEQTLSGRQVGPWMGLPATGRTFEIAVCTVYRFDAEGLLRSEHVYFDRACLRQQLGAPGLSDSGVPPATAEATKLQT